MKITQNDERYPYMFKTIPNDPPKEFVVEGNSSLIHAHAVAIVGCEYPTEKGKLTAYRIAQFLSENGYTIISGMCPGIDQAAHQGAIDAGGMTIAVLPHSLKREDFPQRRSQPKQDYTDFAERILSHNGALLTEYESGSADTKRYLMRNRLVAALGLVCIAIQCEDIKSGTMSTIRRAAQYNRKIWVPYPLKGETIAPQYHGIWQLLEGKVPNIQNVKDIGSRDDYPLVLEDIEEAIRVSKFWAITGSKVKFRF